MSNAATDEEGVCRDEAARRTQIVSAARALEAGGLVVASDGNLSARLDEHRMLITPAGRRKATLEPGALLVCDVASGAVLRGPEDARPSSEWRMHAAAYRSRPDVRAVVHAHPRALVALTLAGGRLELDALPEALLGVGPLGHVEPQVPGSEALAQAVAAAARGSDALVLARHGALTLGVDVEAALFRMQRLAWAADVLALGRLLHSGPVPPLAPELLAALARPPR